MKKNSILIFFSRNIDTSLFDCVPKCSPYFSVTATQEILDELRPRMCPPGWDFGNIMKIFEIFLPFNLPSDLHNQGFEFVYNHSLPFFRVRSSF
jgi:hypothetical protein